MLYASMLGVEITDAKMHVAGTWKVEGSVYRQTRQSVIVACPEEVAYRLSFINAEQLMRLAEPMRKTSYGQHLLNILDHPVYWLEMTPR